MNRKLNILIFEHTSSHSELLYSQIKFINEYNHNIHLWINKNSDTADFTLARLTLIDLTNSKYKIFYKLLRYLITKKIDVIIFNTAHGLFIRDLSLLLLLFKVRAIGILHQADKIMNSSTQKIVSLKIRNYFVLNDFVLKWINEHYKSDKTTFNSFYPIYFPERFYTKKENESYIVFCIPGAIEPERKDYDFLISYLLNSYAEISNKIKFKLLGNISSDNGKKLYAKLVANKIENCFITFNGYVANEVFFQEIINSDFIFPLIHPSGKHFQAFFNTGISGAFSLALAFKKPLLLHNKFKENQDYRDISLFYDENNLFSVIQGILNNRCIVQSLEYRYQEIQKFDFDIQSAKFNGFIT
jgi:hypothetical protein